MKIVDKNILPDEECARCLVHPYGYSDSKGVKESGFAPPRGDTRISLLRMRYANLDFCIQHGKKIGGDKFKALALISQDIVDASYAQWQDKYRSKNKTCNVPQLYIHQWTKAGSIETKTLMCTIQMPACPCMRI